MKRWTYNATTVPVPHPRFILAIKRHCTETTPSTHFWKDVNNQRTFLETVARELQLTQLSDWYKVPRKEVSKRGGYGLFYHHPSLEAALRAAYPEYPWVSSSFRTTRRQPIRHWSKKTNIQLAMKNAETKLGITKPEDWYSITLTELRQLGFPHKVKRSQLYSLLLDMYPEFPWDQLRLLRGKYAQQKKLERMLHTLFKDWEVKTNVRSEAGVVNPITKEFFELDFFIPTLRLAFEYNERHHYAAANYTYLPVSYYTERDVAKRKAAKEAGIDLIEVPFWWDGQQNSLVATIKQIRPELCQGIDYADASAISSEMPEDILANHKTEIEDIGEPTTACFFTTSKIDPTKWWLFEKYDGVRAFWNPMKSKFYSRHGKVLGIPQHIIDAMPSSLFLDGELWFGRNSFQEALKIAHKGDSSSIDWTKFRYMVFDVPNSKHSYQERYNALEQHFQTHPTPYVTVAPKQECKDIAHLEMQFQNIIDGGGEGIILRDPLAEYQPGRSLGYLKHKKFRDAEAKVVGPCVHQQWECELPNGIRFIASPNTSEFVKRWQPQSGDIVSFKHQGYLQGSKKPKMASLFRLRPDLLWEDVVKNWKENTPNPSTGGEYKPLRKQTNKSKERGYWSDRNNRAQFFVKVAEEAGLDAKNPEHWKRITREHIRGMKGGGLLSRYGSVIKALKDTFPDLAVAIPDKKPTRNAAAYVNTL